MRFFSDVLHEQAWPAFFQRPRARRPMILILTLGTLCIDYFTGPEIRFAAFYAPPILLAAWYEGVFWGNLTGLGIVLARFSLERWAWTPPPWPLKDSIITACSGILMIPILVWYTSRAGQLTRTVRLLSALVPICMYCHRIRNETNEYERLEDYIVHRTKSQFSHGICPNCAEQRD